MTPLGQLCSVFDSMVKGIDDAVVVPAPNETIQLIGPMLLHTGEISPDDAYLMARQFLHHSAYDQAPIQWRRYYEEVCLFRVASSMKELASTMAPANATKHQDLTEKSVNVESSLAEMIRILDEAIVIAGAPGRRPLIESLFEQLDRCLKVMHPAPKPQLFMTPCPSPLITNHKILRLPAPLNFGEFQEMLDRNTLSPVIMPNAFDHWPALVCWNDLTYLKSQTLHGYRSIPVEIGKTYTSENWSQKFMTFNAFAKKHLLPEEPEETGYLAQHDMFSQIPSLRNDIATPDYCWTSPPPPTGASASTPGLDKVREHEDPVVNAWLGPKGTRTPLHTDPHHNIFCQVVGYKYVRLYAPTESDKLYSMGTNKEGISMNNTSQVDVSHFRPNRLMTKHDEIEKQRELEKFPLVEQAKYQEAILGPGECLYVPLGWWHYVESLSTSFSVSFWWN